MTQHGPIDAVDIDAWIEDARAALSPRDADRARVLAELEKQLALPPQPPADGGGLTSGHASSTATLSAGKTGGLAHLAHYAVQALLPLLGLGAIAVIATQLHTRAPMPTLRPAQPNAAVVTEAPPPSAAEPELAAQHDPHDPDDAPAPDQADTKTAPAPPPKKKKPQPKKCRTANGQERPCETKSSETALAAAEGPASAPPSAASLSRELEALRQAQRELRSGQAAQALAVLEAFEREAGGRGEMQEERAAAGTMARCTLARAAGEKRGLYGEFVQRYPKSAYAARLQRTCLQSP